jgi:hypothetical protein
MSAMKGSVMNGYVMRGGAMRGGVMNEPVEPPVPPPYEWLAQWTFEGADGSTTLPADLIGGKTISALAGAALSTTTPLEGVSSLLLDGVDDSAVVGDNDMWFLSTNQFGIMIKFNVTSVGALQILLSQFRALNGSRAWRMSVTALGAINFLWSVDGIVTAGTVASANATISAGVNYEALVTKDTDGYIRLYLNGVMVAKSGAPVTSVIRQAATSLRFGCDSDSANVTTNFLGGRIDDVRINNIASPNYGDAGYTP